MFKGTFPDIATNIYPASILYKSIVIIVRLSLLTMTNLNHMREMLLFVCSKMADKTNSSSKLSVADRTTEVRARHLCW